MSYLYQQTTKQALADYSSDADAGLTPEQVQKSRRKYGRNQLAIAHRSIISKILAPFTDILMLVLIVALILSIVQQSWPEVIMITLIIAVDALVYYVQQFTTERILRSLAKTTVQAIRVIRNGAEQSIDAADLVPGDIVILSEGERIAADGRVIEESGLLTNESMLTGESDPVAKDARKLSGDRKIYEQTNMVFSGSFVITGTAKFLVTATGNKTEYGRIASLASTAGSTSPIQEKINKLIVRIAIIVVTLAVIVVIIQLAQGIGFIDALELALAMIVSAIPEGLPIAIAIILALGARRMAKQKALVREMRAIESIGVVTTIASDKTGTLTENKLSIRSVWTPSGSKDLYEQLAESAVTSSTDPLDIAIFDFLELKKKSELVPGQIQSYAFDNDLKVSGNLYRTASGSLRLRIKGAPEAILRSSNIPLSARHAAEIEMHKIASRGQKVIAIASAKIDKEITELADLASSTQFKLDGLIAVADSLRPGAVSAIKTAQKAGVKVKMITGDHFITAMEIGKELGLVEDISQVFDCSQMDRISDADITDVVRTTTVFARVTPELKFKILSAMKATEVVAMTGDGVNDVPALANAHIGISMGSSTSIVQDASDIVLLDDNFRSIIGAMKEGRQVLGNIRRMLLYLLSTNSGEVLSMTGALLLGGHQLVLPIQILWVNLVTDSLLLIPIGLEPAEKHNLRAKPEPKNSPILSSNLIARTIIIAITMATITLATYFISLRLFTPEQANTLAFNALIVMQWANAIAVRGMYDTFFARLRVRHTPFYLALTAAIVLHLLTLFGPLSSLVRTVPVNAIALILVSLISFTLPILVVELHKKFTRSK